MRYCEFAHVADLPDGRKEWHCPHCDYRPKVRSDRPPISECSGESPVEYVRSAQESTTWFRPGTWLETGIKVVTLGLVKPCCKCSKRKRAMDRWGAKVMG